MVIFFINNFVYFYFLGKLYLLPIQDTYDMRHAIKDKPVLEQPTGNFLKKYFIFLL